MSKEKENNFIFLLFFKSMMLMYEYECMAGKTVALMATVLCRQQS